MAAIVLDGSALASSLRSEVQCRAEAVRERLGRPPGLAVILVGVDPGSASYVRGKRRAAAEVGLASFDIDLPADTGEAALLAQVARLNAEPAVDGILVQLPLPAAISAERVIAALDPDRDVDGFHPVNAGRLLLGLPGFVPCTPLGIQQLLLRAGIPTDGAEVVVVGRSRIVGRPLSVLLSGKGTGANATVTLCHTGTRDLATHTRRADILVVAAGRPRAVGAEMVKPGAAVIDVGTNRIGTTPSGKARLCGDVDFAPVAERAGWITPVPGGVGPLTIAMLMHNVTLAAERRAGLAPAL